MEGYPQYAGFGVDPYAQHPHHDPAAGYGYQQAGYPGYAPPPPHPGAGPEAFGGAEELRTVYLSGFPADVMERELNNLLRFLPGYEASQMNWRNNQAQGFALFSSGAAARAAKDACHNLCYDDTAVLRADMARKNMYFKDSDPTAKRPKIHPSGPPGGGGGGYEQYQGYQGYGGYTPTPAGAQPSTYQQVSNTKDNPPCNTLFIGNLGDHASEAELRGIFGHHPGFSQLKMVRSARSTTCFVEFTDVASAMVVHQQQQGAILQSSDRGGIRIQYSKNPFGKKRDATGQLVSLKSGEPVMEPPLHSDGTPKHEGA